MELSSGVARLRTRSTERWREGLREHFLPLEFGSNRGSGDFLATLVARDLGGAHLASVSSGAHSVTRTRVLAERSERRYLKLFWQLSGASRIEQAGRTSDLRPGCWTFYDTSRPYVIEVSDASRFAVMLVPQELCSAWSAHCAESAGRAFASSGTSRVAVASLMTALHDPQGYEPLAANAVVSSISVLLLNALKCEAARENQSALQNRLSQAHAYISSRIDSPDLSPDQIAAALRVSRRTLYAWFARNGDSPSAFIQKTRLERCRLALTDPSHWDKTITHIAFDHGFSDMAHFSRLFKSAYGIGPREYRKRYMG